MQGISREKCSRLGSAASLLTVVKLRHLSGLFISLSVYSGTHIKLCRTPPSINTHIKFIFVFQLNTGLRIRG